MNLELVLSSIRIGQNPKLKFKMKKKKQNSNLIYTKQIFFLHRQLDLLSNFGFCLAAHFR